MKSLLFLFLLLLCASCHNNGPSDGYHERGNDYYQGDYQRYQHGHQDHHGSGKGH